MQGSKANCSRRRSAFRLACLGLLLASIAALHIWTSHRRVAHTLAACEERRVAFVQSFSQIGARSAYHKVPPQGTVVTCVTESYSEYRNAAAMASRLTIVRDLENSPAPTYYKLTSNLFTGFRCVGWHRIQNPQFLNAVDREEYLITAEAIAAEERGEIDRAIALYSISYGGDCVARRAVCWFKLGKYNHVLEDCGLVLHAPRMFLTTAEQEAYQVRGLSYLALGEPWLGLGELLKALEFGRWEQIDRPLSVSHPSILQERVKSLRRHAQSIDPLIE